jgi:hypothetical protein
MRNKHLYCRGLTFRAFLKASGVGTGFFNLNTLTDLSWDRETSDAQFPTRYTLRRKSSSDSTALFEGFRFGRTAL